MNLVYKILHAVFFEHKVYFKHFSLVSNASKRGFQIIRPSVMSLVTSSLFTLCRVKVSYIDINA